MKKYLSVILLSACGCTAFTQAQIDLVTQARKRVAAIAERDVSRRNETEQLARLRREKLDRAFDEDVRQQADLSRDWVIDARKAYAAALDAYAKQQAAAGAADAAERQNLAAVDAALQRLQWLQSMQLRFSNLWEVGQ